MSSENKKEAFSLKTLWNLCKQRRKFIVIFVAAFVVLSGVYTYITSYEYSASAKVFPPETDGGAGGLSGFLQSLSGGVAIGEAMGKSVHIELYLDMLNSRAVAKHIAEKCKLNERERFQVGNETELYDMVSSMIEAESRRSGIIIINSSIETPYFPDSSEKAKAANFISEFVNAAVEGLDEVNKRRTNFKSKKKREYIAIVLKENERKLDSVDAELEKFQRQHKVLSLDEQTKAILENAIIIGTELSKAEVQLGLSKQEFEKGSPIVKAFRRKVEDLRSQYQKIQSGGLIQEDKFSIPLTNVPELIRKYTNLKREQEILTQVNLYLKTQKHQHGIQAESDVPTIQVLDEAVPPYVRSSPSRVMTVVLALFLSLFLSVFIVVARAYAKGEVYIPKETGEDS